MSVASRWRRLFASLFDGLFVVLFSLPLWGTYTEVAKTKDWLHPWGTDSSLWPVLFIHNVLTILFFALCQQRWGRSPGKLLLGIKVVSASTGELPDFGQTLLRSLVQFGAVELPAGGRSLAWMLSGCCSTAARAFTTNSHGRLWSGLR